jgi:hypothetical protein
MSLGPQYFYHLMPSPMYGRKLLPLSDIAIKYPSLAEKQKENYEGRSELLSKRVKPLDCTWKDVLFCSCLNPAVIFAALEMLGLLDNSPPKIMKFPIDRLESDCCLYREVGNRDAFKAIDSHSYREQKMLPIETIEYFIECAKTGASPLIFSGVQHLLIKGSLDVGEAEIFEYQKLID